MNKLKSVFKSEWSDDLLNKFYISDIRSTLVLGSCDARNLNRLIGRTYKVKPKNVWEIFYNPFSIREELERLFHKSKKWESGVYKFKKDGEVFFCDPWRSWMRAKSIEELKKKNSLFDKRAFKSLLNVKNLVLVFGLSEVWFHKNSKTIMNRVPIELSLREIKQNYGVKLASLRAISHCLDKITKIIHENLNTNLILSVSPVPLKYSSLTQDILLASMKSKKNLVDSCKKIASKKVIYFPSYDLLSHYSYFQEDGRHLTPEAVVHLLSLLINKPIFKNFNPKKFYVPKVNKYGIIKGKLYLKDYEK